MTNIDNQSLEVLEISKERVRKDRRDVEYMHRSNWKKYTVVDIEFT